MIGEIVGATELTTDNSFCVYQFKTGRQWSCVGGDVEGQTQTDYPIADDAGGEAMNVWNHPIDVHFYTKSVEGWPKMIFEVRYRGGCIFVRGLTDPCLSRPLNSPSFPLALPSPRPYHAGLEPGRIRIEEPRRVRLH